MMLQITITNSSLCLLQNSRNLCLVPDSLWLPASGTCASVCFQTKLPGGGRGTATATEAVQEPLGEPLPGQPGGTRRQQRAKRAPFVNRSGSPPTSSSSSSSRPRHGGALLLAVPPHLLHRPPPPLQHRAPAAAAGGAGEAAGGGGRGAGMGAGPSRSPSRCPPHRVPVP